MFDYTHVDSEFPQIELVECDSVAACSDIYFGINVENNLATNYTTGFNVELTNECARRIQIIFDSVFEIEKYNINYYYEGELIHLYFRPALFGYVLGPLIEGGRGVVGYEYFDLPAYRCEFNALGGELINLVEIP